VFADAFTMAVEGRDASREPLVAKLMAAVEAADSSQPSAA
jgi:hypothetical protein